ncbi:MAG: ribosome biogenesis GTPase Der [Caldimicrobium sp.]|nr:ribosome biogenesis GTPase Der [Caldimicrobium sp.]MCX7873266.1 ribosome biogenesis GTPase Der [Caldimicrobium sp.]MDW8094722.1 ribosome biogenesis GTPase Der [Caldimicrobium sp.]
MGKKITWGEEAVFQVVIVGRPNVGKSTLFNTLIGERKAIVEKSPGITRDFLVGYVELEEGKGIKVIDTGGIDLASKDFFSQAIRDIVEATVKEADLIIYVVDAKEGPTGGDEEIASYLRSLNKRVLLVVNKVESKADQERAREFYALGLGELIPISAKNRLNIDLLKDHLKREAGHQLFNLPQEPAIKVAIMGRPNVGKSTLLNRLVGYERMLVSEIPGTTRDCVDVLLEREGALPILLIDTPGIRRRARIEERAEKFSVDKALETLMKVDVVILLITAEEGLTHQDKTLLRLIDKNFKAGLLLVNKWDLLIKKRARAQAFLEVLKGELKFLPWMPYLLISAKEGLNVDEILKEVEEIYQQYKRRVSTAKVNDLLEELMNKYSFNVRGKRVKFYYATQIEVAPPTFVVFTNIEPERIPSHLERFIKRRFQQFLGFTKVPVRVIFRLRS